MGCGQAKINSIDAIKLNKISPDTQEPITNKIHSNKNKISTNQINLQKIDKLDPENDIHPLFEPNTGEKNGQDRPQEITVPFSAYNQKLLNQDKTAANLINQPIKITHKNRQIQKIVQSQEMSDLHNNSQHSKQSSQKNFRIGSSKNIEKSKNEQRKKITMRSSKRSKKSSIKLED